MAGLLPRLFVPAIRTGGVALLGTLALLATEANAQYQVQQTGRLLDANPQIGSGGINYARPVSPLIVGNAVATGNVRGGFAFQGYDPISSPTSFRASLGSAALSGFRRDAVSVADASAPYGTDIVAPYYDSS